MGLEQAYNWNPLPTGQLTVAQQKFINGVQCILWSEFITTPDQVDYQLWPRACATAEVGWTDQNQRNWSDFKQRLGLHLTYLDTLNVKYRVKPPRGVISRELITIQAAYPGSTTVYTTDGSEPTAQSALYAGEAFPADMIESLRYRTLTQNGRLSKIAQGASPLPVGHWSPADFPSPARKILSYPVKIDSDGIWFADFKRMKGQSELKIHSCYISIGNQKVSSRFTTQNLINGSQVTRRKFDLTGTNPNATYLLNVVVQAIDGSDTYGIVTFDKSLYLEPAFSVMTNVPHTADKSTAKLSDYIPETHYQSKRNINKGDLWIINFSLGVNTSKIVLPTGKPGTNDKILQAGTLEYTTDGITWLSGFPYTQGTSMIIFDRPHFIKALRITATADQESSLILRDPVVYP